MKGRLLLSVVLALLCRAMPLLADPGPGMTAYRAQLTLYPGDDGAAMAKRLAAMYRGTLETPVDADGGFVITLSPAGADLMGRDPTVERLVAAEASAAAASVPETTAVATPWKLGNYEYDGAGNIRRIGPDFYVYDTRGRLVVSADASAIPVVHKQAYTYDDFGNITTITTAGTGQTTLSADTSSNQVTTVSGGLSPATLVYDAAGNMTRYGTATYTYDALHMLTRTAIEGVTRHHVYSASDERIGTVEVSSAGTRSDWTLRDAGGQVLRRLSRETNGEWKWQEDYIYRGTQMLAAEVADSSKTRHFHLDHLGTPRLITGNGGAQLSRHNYHPFGVEIEPISTSSTSVAREKKQFTGHERDAESLDYMHARFYAPYMGRFLSVDPTWESADLGKPQSWNRYAYVMNNPVNTTDPDGKLPILVNLLFELGTDFVTDGNPTGTIADDPPRTQAELDQRVRDGRAVRVSEQHAKLDQPGGPKRGRAGGPGAGKKFDEKTKEAARAQSDNKCVFCQTETTRTPGPNQSNIDHAIAKARGGNNTLENAQNACRTCNLKKAVRDTVEYLTKLFF